MKKFELSASQSLLRNKILNTLSMVKDPELEINIVDMGLIYGVDLQGGSISIEMTLSSKGCSMGGSILDAVKNCLEEHYPTYLIKVELVWEPAWTVDLISAEGRAELRI